MTRQKLILCLTMILVTIFSVSDSRAREDWFILTYDISIPVGDTADFISEIGWRGIGIEGRWFVTDNFNPGFVLGWQNMYEKFTDATTQVDNATISGTQVRYLDFIPILVGANYHFFDRSYRIRPYVGVKGGVYWVKQRVEIGFVDVIINKNWHLGAAPEAGFTFLTGSTDIYGFVSGDFTYVLGREDSIDYTYWGVSLGLVYVF
jgi:hypothetical protein